MADLLQEVNGVSVETRCPKGNRNIQKAEWAYQERRFAIWVVSFATSNDIFYCSSLFIYCVCCMALFMCLCTHMWRLDIGVGCLVNDSLFCLLLCMYCDVYVNTGECDVSKCVGVLLMHTQHPWRSQVIGVHVCHFLLIHLSQCLSLNLVLLFDKQAISQPVPEIPPSAGVTGALRLYLLVTWVLGSKHRSSCYRKSSPVL